MSRLGLLSCLLVACSSGSPPGLLDAGSAQVEPDARPPAQETPPSDAAPPRQSSYVKPGFCERPADDAVRDIFCGEQDPGIDRLRTLQDRLGVNRSIRAADDAGVGDAGDDYAGEDVDPTTVIDIAVFMGHSTALSGRLVSPINPRAIVLARGALMTFQRGVQQVEIVASSRNSGDINFYLLQFEQACNDRPGGCRPGDLFTPSVERDWQRLLVRDAEDLKNTSLDCRQCHQRGREHPMLLMRELQSPWTHFFEVEYPDYEPGALPGVRGVDLVHDYMSAKGEESYAGIAAFTLRHTFGVVLQNIVNRDQPLLFDAPRIEEERWPFDEQAGTYSATPQPSATWEAAYEAFKRGEQLALPYFDARPTDPVKQARLTKAYQDYQAGRLSADELPDLSDVFPDDPLTRAKIGLQTEPGASAPELLIQACGACHNDVLDQTISRARFNIELARMSREELDRAVARIELPSHAPGAMPPPEGRQLDAAGRAALLAYLRVNQRSAEDDAMLSHAARIGMTGGYER